MVNYKGGGTELKKVLIISPYFAPENTVASIRFTKIAKYLKQMGYSVTVICSENMAVSTKDRILENDSSSLDRIFRLPPISFNRWIKSIYSKIEKKDNDNRIKKQKTGVKREKNSIFFKLINSKIYHNFLDNWIYAMEILQGYSFIKYVKKNKKAIGKFDYVLSTYGPISSHMLAEYMKKKGLCKVWLADFRDVVYDVMGKEKRVDIKRKKRLARTCVKADYVTAITTEMLKSLNEYTERFYRQNFSAKMHCISNGFDAEERAYLKSSDNTNDFEIVYCGVIYSTGEKLLRDPRPLFQAIRELVDEKKIEEEKIVFRYAGKTYDEFCRVAQQYRLDNRTYNHGFVERVESLNLQRNADVILSLSWNTKKDKGIMTGKIYEAFLAESNILCLVSGDEPGSDLSKMINETSTGLAWEEGNNDSIDIIKKWILQLYNEKMKKGVVTYLGNKENINRYSYVYLAKEFEELLLKLKA